MRLLKEKMKKIALLPNQALTVDTNGTGVDTYQDGSKPAFETALVDIAIGALGTQATTKVKIEESDASDFSSGVQIAKGGDEITVAASTNYKMEIQRTKRYLRAVLTLTTPGGVPSVGIYVGAYLWNAQTPFPIS